MYKGESWPLENPWTLVIVRLMELETPDFDWWHILHSGIPFLACECSLCHGISLKSVRKLRVVIFIYSLVVDFSEHFVGKQRCWILTGVRAFGIASGAWHGLQPVTGILCLDMGYDLWPMTGSGPWHGLWLLTGVLDLDVGYGSWLGFCALTWVKVHDRCSEL